MQEIEYSYNISSLHVQVNTIAIYEKKHKKTQQNLGITRLHGSRSVSTCLIRFYGRQKQFILSNGFRSGFSFQRNRSRVLWRHLYNISDMEHTCILSDKSNSPFRLHRCSEIEQYQAEGMHMEHSGATSCRVAALFIISICLAVLFLGKNFCLLTLRAFPPRSYWREN